MAPLAKLALIGASAVIITAMCGGFDTKRSTFVPIQGNVKGVILSGYPTIHDGDTLRVAGQSVRLYGVDAEELDEPHGVDALLGLRRIVGDQWISCALTGARSYNRVVGVCHLPDGTSINEEIIRRGAALDCARYSYGQYRKFEPAGARDKLTQKGYCDATR